MTEGAKFARFCILMNVFCRFSFTQVKFALLLNSLAWAMQANDKLRHRQGLNLSCYHKLRQGLNSMRLGELSGEGPFSSCK